ncbi:MAG: helix-turn-helix domain-containing protein [Bifidobacteriaceae bacterium]|jgi:hypothetical protein|nr:helix-turn-helix domain-containing protein [Bifidobacteriaceae bacterium]
MNSHTKPIATSDNRSGAAKRYRIPDKEIPVRAERPAEPLRKAGKNVALLRNELGHVLRANRLRQNRTLREVSAAARVSLGYLSEVERGQKEASSELLQSICDALELPLWTTLREVSDRLETHRANWIPDTFDELFGEDLASVR